MYFGAGAHGIPWGGGPWDPRVGPWGPIGPWGPLGLGDPWALGTLGPWGPIGPWGPVGLGDPWALGTLGPLGPGPLGPVYYIYGSTLVSDIITV